MITDQTISVLRTLLGGGNFAFHEPRPAWRLMDQLAPYKQRPRAPLPVAESLAQRLIDLPSSEGLI